MELDHSDVLNLRAALGWLELGNPAEAMVELDALSAAGQEHFDALEARWLALADLKRWDTGIEVAQRLISTAPSRPVGWLHHAYALRRSNTGGVQAAYDALSPVADKFPKEPIIPYNLACYTCQLRRDDTETLAWLQKAIAAGKRQEIVSMALKDPDLSRLRAEISKLDQRS